MVYIGDQKREYQNAWKKRRRQDWIDANGPCGHCGASNDLEVDHIDPSQKVNHNIWSWSAKRRDAELAKCQVLCRGCNLGKSIVLGAVFWKHGTYTAYAYHGCRCALCTRVASARTLLNRKKRKLCAA